MSGLWISRVKQCLPIFVNMTEFWMLSGFNNGSVLNIPRFRICQVSAYARVTQGSEYAWIWLNNVWIKCFVYGRVLNISGQSLTRFWMPSVPNMSGIGILRSCEYARVTQGSENAWRSCEYAITMSQHAWIRLNTAGWIRLNIPEYIWINKVLNMPEFWMCLIPCIA